MEHVYLQGSEEVMRAAIVMRDAAREIAHAVGNLESEHRRHEQAMRDLLSEAEQEARGR